MISAIINPAIAYPASTEYFSPDERYPEYPFDHTASRPNAVYQAVRQLLQQTGLDAAHYGTPRWNPLGQWIRPGQTVFVLCNFVYHRRSRDSLEQFASKCTHGSVVRAVIDYVLIATGPTGRVRFGNAPLQSCVWPRVLDETGAKRVEDFYTLRKAPVESADLRLFVDELSGNPLTAKCERRAETGGVLVDLGPRSLLAALDGARPQYRISDYSPKRTETFHQNGAHQYVLHRHIMESDVIVSIPKLKTHEKVGITCAVKGCVGAIGHKDCLPHHRRGDPENGGDEFRADRWGVLASLTGFHDRVQGIRPGTVQGRAARFLFRAVRSLVRRFAPTMNGAWSGNDTCWRMAADIARLIAHARRDGTIVPELVRPHLAFLDGIVGGEGDGPLNPTPVKTGALVFATDPVTLDTAAAHLMGYDPEQLPIVREAARLRDLPLGDTVARAASAGSLDRPRDPIALATVNGQEIPLSRLRGFADRAYLPPQGWRMALITEVI